jgi:hypothetical protein
MPYIKHIEDNIWDIKTAKR